MLKVKNIETLYGLIMAIRGVSLEVQEGQIAAILGANGAGKTTILKTIMGLQVADGFNLVEQSHMAPPFF